MKLVGGGYFKTPNLETYHGIRNKISSFKILSIFISKLIDYLCFFEIDVFLP